MGGGGKYCQIIFHGYSSVRGCFRGLSKVKRFIISIKTQKSLSSLVSKPKIAFVASIKTQKIAFVASIKTQKSLLSLVSKPNNRFRR